MTDINERIKTVTAQAEEHAQLRVKVAEAEAEVAIAEAVYAEAECQLLRLEQNMVQEDIEFFIGMVQPLMDLGCPPDLSSHRTVSKLPDTLFNISHNNVVAIVKTKFKIKEQNAL